MAGETYRLPATGIDFEGELLDNTLSVGKTGQKYERTN